MLVSFSFQALLYLGILSSMIAASMRGPLIISIQGFFVQTAD